MEIFIPFIHKIEKEKSNFELIPLYIEDSPYQMPEKDKDQDKASEPIIIEIL